jgi:flagellar basal body L-ring protein FlgH
MVNDTGVIDTGQQGDQYSQIKMDATSDHTGEGKTHRKNEFKTKLSGQVIEVLPNSHLVVEAKKTIQINGENQLVTLIGVVDPNDLDEDSEVMGERIMDLHISFTGQGEVSDAIKTGWLTKLVSKFKPF